MAEPLRAVDAQPTTGDLYVVGGSGALYRVNPRTGNAVFAGDTGMNWSESASASFDPITGHLHVVERTGTRVHVDVTTNPIIVVQDLPVRDQNKHPIAGWVGIGHAVDAFSGTAMLYGLNRPFANLARIEATGLLSDATDIKFILHARMGFTIDPTSNTVYATVPDGGTNKPWFLVQVNRGIGTFEDSFDNTVGFPTRIAVVPSGAVQFETSSAATSEATGSVAVNVVRVGSSHGPISIDYTTQVSGAGRTRFHPDVRHADLSRWRDEQVDHHPDRRGQRRRSRGRDVHAEPPYADARRGDGDAYVDDDHHCAR